MTREQAEQYVWAMVARAHRYHYGGDDPIQGFDCSGLVHEFLMAFGVAPFEPKPSAQQLFAHYLSWGLKQASQIPPELPEAYFGAMAFFGESEKLVDHVGFCVSPTHMVEAGGGDATVIDDKTAIARNGFIKLRPVKYRKGFLGFIRPAYPWD
jgi:cell wall-associated NlpC family hydrolase